MEKCNVCGTQLGESIFRSDSRTALTSLCELRDGRVQVWSCSRCGHLLGNALQDTEGYYETDYRILIDHEDEDQIYEVRGQDIIYRTEHQVSTLLGAIELPEGARLLDYGCAKASTPKRLLSRRPDLQIHLFDVSEMYMSFWDRFVAVDHRAVHSTPDSWQCSFDVVTSFFALEHIPDPSQTVLRIAALLKAGGTFYGIVPDTFGNVADFIVIDHVNHFTTTSLHYLLSAGGFSDIRIDANAHRGALVFSGVKNGGTIPAAPAPDPERSRSLARYWKGISERINNADVESPGKIAIYGSGFYGAYIFSTLHRTHDVECFLDRSPYQQGKKLFGKPIIAPEYLPADVRSLFVGLNPAIARNTMAAMRWLGNPGLRLIYLDGETA